MKMSEYFEFQFATRLQNPRVSYLDKKQTKFKNESAEQKRALCVLKEMIGASKDLALRDKSCCGDDEFLTRFLYARKFKCTEAFDLIVNYHSYKQKNRALLQKLTIFDEILQLAIRDGFPSIVKERDRRGRKVIIFIASNWDPGLYSIEVIYRSFLLSLEKLLEDRQNQSQGFVVIVDWTNFSMRQSTYLTPKVLRLMIEGLQDCFPAKFKAVHFIGQPWYVEVALAVIKPFLREKTKERIKMHGGNLSTLHECVPKDILPTELGGEGPNLNPLDWYHILVESSQTKEAPKTYIMTETTVYSMVPIATKNKISSEKIDNNLQ